MLISKTVCSAGSSVSIVPLGLQITLHYDMRGNLMKVYQGFDTKVELDDEFMKTIVRMGLVPSAIKLTGGSTDVWGVFLSEDITAANSLLPDCEFERIKSDIMSGMPGYKFYVACITTGAEAMVNSASVQNWARGSNFNVCPSWLVPTDASDQTLETYLNVFGKGVVTYPKVAGYVIYESNGRPYYHSNDLRTATVTKAKRHTDLDGFIKYEVTYGNKQTIDMNYPDAVKFNMQKGAQFIMDRGQVIWSSTATDAAAPRLAPKITCEHCNKILDVPVRGMMNCNDPFCTSLLFPRIEKFCKTLDLLILAPAKFKKYVKEHQIQILPDILLLDEYKDIKVEKDLWEIIYSVVPNDVCLDSEWLKKFCAKCNNQYKTAMYYFNGPLRIKTELDMDVPVRFARWLDEPRNLTELDTIVNSEQINIIDRGVIKFEAMPILHDKTIFITGTFTHGSYEDITAILRSYSAEVITEFDEFVNYVLVGDIKENISGEAIQGARALKIPIVDESVFFDHYRIDEDLENLV